MVCVTQIHCTLARDAIRQTQSHRFIERYWHTLHTILSPTLRLYPCYCLCVHVITPLLIQQPSSHCWMCVVHESQTVCEWLFERMTWVSFQRITYFFLLIPIHTNLCWRNHFSCPCNRNWVFKYCPQNIYTLRNVERKKAERIRALSPVDPLLSYAHSFFCFRTLKLEGFIHFPGE